MYKLGTVRPASDILGRHVIRLDDTPGCRNALATRLITAGCSAKTTGSMWLAKGDFSLKDLSPPEALVASSAQVQSAIDIRFVVEGVWVEKATPLFERLQKAIDGITEHGVKVIEKIEQIDRYIDSSNRERLIPETTDQDELRRRLQGGEFEEIYNETERIPKRDDKAERYKQIAGLCLDIDDKYNAFRAANKYLEWSDNSAPVYRFLGYIYWWFEDIDTAIVQTERALQIAEVLRGGEPQAETMRTIENNLAFYYAEKGINKDRAVFLAEKSIRNLSEGHEHYVHLMDTAGYVFLKFGTTEEEMDIAIDCFRRVLDKAPETRDTLFHLQEALIKKKELRKQREEKAGIEVDKRKPPTLT